MSKRKRVAVDANRLRAELAKRNVSQAQVGNAIGRSDSYVSVALKEEGGFPQTELELICFKFGIDMETVLAKPKEEVKTEEDIKYKALFLALVGALETIVESDAFKNSITEAMKEALKG